MTRHEHGDCLRHRRHSGFAPSRFPSRPFGECQLSQGKSGAERLYDAAEKAADIGTLAHAMVEASIKGEARKACSTARRPEDKDKATNAFKEYLEWAAQTDVKIIAQEMHLCQRRIPLRRDA
jgi:hypothetical protein